MKKLILVLTLVAVTIFAYSNNLIAQSDSDCCQILNPCVVTRGESIAFTIKSPCGFGGFDFSNPVALVILAFQWLLRVLQKTNLRAY